MKRRKFRFLNDLVEHIPFQKSSCLFVTTLPQLDSPAHVSHWEKPLTKKRETFKIP